MKMVNAMTDTIAISHSGTQLNVELSVKENMSMQLEIIL